MKQNINIAAEIEGYKKRNTTAPNTKKLDWEYDPTGHDIFKKTHIYKDKWIESEYEDEKGEMQKSKTLVPLNRIGLPYQKYITKVAVTFLFGNPVKYANNDSTQEKEKSLYDAFKKVISKNKMQFVDREIASTVSRFTECAELWYDYEGKEDYAFPSDRILKVKILKPDVEKLFPIFDDKDNLTSFGREFKSGDNTYFVVYTAEKEITYKEEKGTWTKNEVPNLLKKIPVVYYRQEEVEWEDVQSSILRLEKIYMNAAESNDKFAFPILGLHGEVTGQFSKDDSGKVIQLKGDNSRAEFVVPPQANEGLKDEIGRLDDMIHLFTNTPNVFSLKNIEGLGNMLGGENAKFIFLSAHLKVMEKSAIYIPALMRRVSILKAYLKTLNPKFEKEELDVEPIITPYIVDNEQEFNRYAMEMTGGKQLWSTQYAMEKMGISDAKKMQEEIDTEKELSAAEDII